MTRQESQPEPQAGTNPPPGTPIIADVFAKPGSGGIDFSLDWRFQGEANPRNGPMDIPPRKPQDPGTPIHFNLRDSTGRHLQFDTTDPIWVARTNCPNSPSTDPEIPANQVQGHPQLLQVFDRNSEKCDLRYALVFKDRDGNREEFDPMIRNGGLF